MLSVLIPVYNFNVVKLVNEIHRQIFALKVNFEIIVIDDCSMMQFKKQNRAILELHGVQYEQLPENIGRSRLRNKLARVAKFSWLLFMDCDTEIENSDFFATYLKYFSGNQVICGGRSYQVDRPENPGYYLRWKYGSRREQIPAAIRNHKPWNSFMTNNFAISRSVFDQVEFDETIDKYGHEDTFFGIELKRNGIPVLHIDNPLLHIGLETCNEFLVKTEEGIENLLYLMETRNEYRDELISGIKILKHFSWLKKSGIAGIYRFFFKVFKTSLRKNLIGCKPKLVLFDLFKLGLLIEKKKIT